MASDPLRELWRGQERFYGAFLHSGIGMALVSLEGRFLDANPAFCRFLGYSEEEVRKLDFQTLTHPDDLAADLEQVNRLLAGECEAYSMEKRYRHRNGQSFWALLTVSLVRDGEGKPEFFISQVQDVTDRRRVEQAVRASRERLRQATSAGGVGTWDFEFRTRRLEWNDVTCELFGVAERGFEPTPEAALGLVHPEDRERVRAAIRSRLDARGGDFRIEFRIVRPDGSIRHVRTGGQILCDEQGALERIVGVVIDLTGEVEALEAARRASRAKSDFLAMMSHEIRTPMNGMLGFASLLRSTGLDDVQAGYLATVDACGQRLLGVVNDILDLSRIEAGSLPVEPAPFELRSCVEEVFDILRPAAEKKNLRYHLSIDPHAPAVVVSDRGRLAQILTNLLGNAVKFTDEGSVELSVGARPDADSWVWEFDVSDCGPGIPAEALEQIFDPYFQADPAGPQRRGGTGLGLAISRLLAGLLGGGISVENRPGGGTLFRVWIRGAVAPLTRPEIRPAVRSFSDIPVLVAEDNEINRRLCGLQLRRLGCLADFACTGREAVEMAVAGNHAVILMDVQLPELDGCAATRAIRAQERCGRRIPIIAMTANAMPQDREKCLEAGMDDYLSKPVRIEALGEVLSRWIPAS